MDRIACGHQQNWVNAKKRKPDESQAKSDLSSGQSGVNHPTDKIIGSHFKPDPKKFEREK
jgi:hypothetical protein